MVSPSAAVENELDVENINPAERDDLAGVVHEIQTALSNSKDNSAVVRSSWRKVITTFCRRSHPAAFPTWVLHELPDEQLVTALEAEFGREHLSKWCTKVATSNETKLATFLGLPDPALLALWFGADPSRRLQAKALSALTRVMLAEANTLSWDECYKRTLTNWAERVGLNLDTRSGRVRAIFGRMAFPRAEYTKSVRLMPRDLYLGNVTIRARSRNVPEETARESLGTVTGGSTVNNPDDDDGSDDDDSRRDGYGSGGDNGSEDEDGCDAADENGSGLEVVYGSRNDEADDDMEQEVGRGARPAELQQNTPFLEGSKNSVLGDDKDSIFKARHGIDELEQHPGSEQLLASLTDDVNDDGMAPIFRDSSPFPNDVHGAAASPSLHAPPSVGAMHSDGMGPVFGQFMASPSHAHDAAVSLLPPTLKRTPSPSLHPATSCKRANNGDLNRYDCLRMPARGVPAQKCWLNATVVNDVLGELVRGVNDPHLVNVDSALIKDPASLGRQQALISRVTDDMTHRIFLPVNLDDLHWLLVVVDKPTLRIETYDSMVVNGVSKQLRSLVNQFLQTTLPNTIVNEWTWDAPPVPKQKDAASCGVATLLFAAHLVGGTPLPPNIHPACWRLSFTILLKELIDPLGCETVIHDIRNHLNGKDFISPTVRIEAGGCITVDSVDVADQRRRLIEERDRLNREIEKADKTIANMATRRSELASTIPGALVCWNGLLRHTQLHMARLLGNEKVLYPELSVRESCLNLVIQYPLGSQKQEIASRIEAIRREINDGKKSMETMRRFSAAIEAVITELELYRSKPVTSKSVNVAAAGQS